MKSQISVKPYTESRVRDAYISYKSPLTIQDSKDITSAINDTRRTLFQLIGGLVFFLTVVITWRRMTATEKTLAITQEGNITDLFVEAVKLLGETGEDKIAMRLGGIYALERIAKTSVEDRGPILGILTAYIREKAHVEDQRDNNEQSSEYVPPLQKQKMIMPDIQAILTVLGRRIKSNDHKENYIDLSSTNLGEANLRDAYLRDANLWKANLRGANLRDANLWRAYLGEADLRGAYLEGADLGGAYLGEANLRDANLSSADLGGAYLEGADLGGTNLRGTNLRGADLRGANLRKANLRGAYLRDADLRKAHLGEAYLSEVDLMGADLRESYLRNAHLGSVAFNKADLGGAYLREANFNLADLWEANLSKADLREADLSGAMNLTQEQVDFAIINDDTLLPPGLEPKIKTEAQQSKDIPPPAGTVKKPQGNHDYK